MIAVSRKAPKSRTRVAKPLRAERKRRGLKLFAALILGIALFAVFGDRGLLDLMNLKGQRDAIVLTNRDLERENRDIEKKIALLKNNRRYIGEIARTELGMIGRNEVIYRFR